MPECICPRCGGGLALQGNGRWECTACRRSFDDNSLQRQVEFIRRELQANIHENVTEEIIREKERMIAMHRRELWRVINNQYVDPIEVTTAAFAITTLLPEDTQAKFYINASQRDSIYIKRFLSRLSRLDAALYSCYLPDFINYLMHPYEERVVGVLKVLIQKAFEERSNEYRDCHDIIDNASRDRDIYNPELPRDVFVACSSSDIEKAMEMVDYLEDRELTCFIYTRNLAQGRNAVAEYETRLRNAMDHCKVFLFVSTSRSRRADCDAYRVEMGYLKERYSNQRRRKPRVEWLLEAYPSSREEYSVSETDIRQNIFNGLTWRLEADKEQVYNDIVQYRNIEDDGRSILRELSNIYKEIEKGSNAYSPFDIYKRCELLCTTMTPNDIARLSRLESDDYSYIEDSYDKAKNIIESISKINETTRRKAGFEKEIEEKLKDLDKFPRFIIYNENRLYVTKEAAQIEEKMQKLKEPNNSRKTLLHRLQDILQIKKSYAQKKDKFEQENIYSEDALGKLKDAENLLINEIASYVGGIAFNGEILRYTEENKKKIDAYNAIIVEEDPQELFFQKLQEKLEAKFNPKLKAQLYRFKEESVLKKLSSYYNQQWDEQAKQIENAKLEINSLGVNESKKRKIQKARDLVEILTEEQKSYLKNEIRRLENIEREYKINKIKNRKSQWKKNVVRNWILSLISTVGFIIFLSLGFFNIIFSKDNEWIIWAFTGGQIGIFAANLLGSILVKNVDYDAISTGIKEDFTVATFFKGLCLWVLYIVIGALSFASAVVITFFLSKGIVCNLWVDSYGWIIDSRAINITILISTILLFLGILMFLFVGHKDRCGYVYYLFKSCAGRFCAVFTVLVIGFAAGPIAVTLEPIMALTNNEAIHYGYVENFLYQSAEEYYGISTVDDENTEALVVFPLLTRTQEVLSVPDTIDGKPVIAVEKTPQIKNLGVTVAGMIEKTPNYIQEVVIPEGVQSIGENAFENCTKLQRIQLPQSLTTIGKNAFYNCDGITSIVLPEQVTAINEKVFASCENLMEVTLNNVVEIKESAFEDCTNLKDVINTSTVVTIGCAAFKNCENLQEFSFENICTIKDNAFEKCTSFNDITIFESVTEIGDNAFMDCALGNITLKSEKIKIGEKAFGDTFGCPITFSNTFEQFKALFGKDIIFSKSLTDAFMISCSNGKVGWIENGQVYGQVQYNSSDVPTIVNDKLVLIKPAEDVNALAGKTLTIDSNVQQLSINANGLVYNDFSIVVKNRSHPLKVSFKDFKFTSSTEYAFNAKGINRVELTLEVIGRSSIGTQYAGGNIIATSNNCDLNIIGSGDLILNAGTGDDTNKTGGIAIMADCLTIDMTGGLTAIGGNGGKGVDAPQEVYDGKSGGQGGNGGIAIICNQLNVKGNTKLTAQGGNGGTGGKGAQGSQGRQGDKGAGASANGDSFLINNANGSPGENGKTGNTGGCGGNGGNGAYGISVSKSFYNESINVNITGGNGGDGGQGGKGGKGGTGGTGGDDDWGGIGFNNPGQGGNGGQGGTGGRGGTGGNRALAHEASLEIQGAKINAKEGRLGSGGAGGDPGDGGDRGAGGSGTGEGIGVGGNGSPGYPGKLGNKGEDGGVYSS